ncbi:hypothetical protein BCR36DRAFT_284045, partial [Piromyces finnis]
YSIIKLFQKFGKIKNIEYLWHRYGPKKGEPKGYCFLEFEESEVIFINIHFLKVNLY